MRMPRGAERRRLRVGDARICLVDVDEAAPSIVSDAIKAILDGAIAAVRDVHEGEPASYIPELANAPLDATSAAITLRDGTVIASGDVDHRFTYQSSAKLVLFAGLLEERGSEEVFRTVGTEPSGGGFAS